MIKLFFKFLLAVLCCTQLIISCSKDSTEDDVSGIPVISLDQEIPIYTVKVGQTLEIIPTVENAGNNAIYMWKIDGKIISQECSLTYKSDDVGSVYVDFQVINSYGTAEQSLQINVVSLLTPQIVMAVPDKGFSVIVDGELAFEPEVNNAENAEYEWTVNNEPKSKQKDYVFDTSEVGDYSVIFSATNEDGTDRLEFTVRVCSPDEMPFEWMFENTEYNLSLGRTIFIRSYWIKNAFDAVYTWQIDGGEIVQESSDCLFAYTPSAKGKTTVTVTMKNKYGSRTQDFIVNTCAPEGTYRRSVTQTSKAAADHGYFFLPAPSQHINRGATTTYYANQDEVNAAIYNSPGSTEYGGSLGAWGGYLVVGFDHSIENSGGFDLEIEGNAFPGWSEPGIVWVMQDENGDGLPNDTWYELKGSAYGQEGYIRDYAVTYFKGLENRSIAWVDNQGNSGSVDYMHQHSPATMYPRWLDTESYTLVGSRLPMNIYEVSPGYWGTDDFEWGYVDNWSPLDMMTDGDNHDAQFTGNHMRICDAVRYDGQPANLQYIDFVKIQTAVNGKGGWLGEVSTEVGGIRDFNMLK